jgi:cbb3-type cytochrome oxidase maturation protein
MSVVYLMLPLALLLSGSAVAAFVWATRCGQLDDLETPPVRILHDEVPDTRERSTSTDDHP